MNALLLFAGLAGAVGGAGAAAYGVLNPTFRFADMAIVAGTLAVVGGLLMLGMSAALTRLQRIADAVEAQLVPRAAVAATAAPTPVVSPPAAEPARTTTAGLAAVSLALGAPEPRIVPDEPAPVTPTAPLVVATAPAASSSSAAGEWPRVDASDRIVPAESANPPRPAAATNGSASAAEGADAPSPAPESEAVRVLKSGVIDGMAYTLYSDGSVDAELNGKTVHFASIAEWRTHLRESA